MNFFSEEIGWASIDADLLNTSWDMLLTDEKTDEKYKIIINICLEICKKTCSAKEKSKKTPNTQRQNCLDEKRSKFQKKIQRSTNHQTKENVLNQIKEIENNLKISINTERNLRETSAIACCYQEKTQSSSTNS